MPTLLHRLRRQRKQATIYQLITGMETMTIKNQAVLQGAELWKSWIVHPSGNKLPLFQNGNAVLATHSGTNETVVFVARGFEGHADLEDAKLFLRRNGRLWTRIECVDATTLSDMLAHGTLSTDRVILCMDDRLFFWSEGPHNKRCAYCRKNAADGDFDW